jgi:4-amino-4-deoxy-L-arabinose transferase-like glycosyltransferase
MSLALPAEPSQASMRARRWVVAGLWLDLAALGGLALAAAAILIWRYDAWPLQLWDESRNANNALEIALHGRWLVPTFDGVPDHWNTKPPLLIWLMAAGMKLGLPPLLAIRLPSWIAAYGALGMVWSALRFGLKDRAAAAIGGALLLASLAYVGPHAARTGDFDALESLFVTGYVLCGWRVFEDQRRRLAWLAGAAGLAVLAVLTKGVAGLLATPGLLVLAALRWRTGLVLVRDARVWALAATAIGLCAGYYLLREQLDPGYLRAVLANEIGGRFSAVTENHKGPWYYYLQILAGGFEPGLPLLASVAVTLRGGDARRRSLALAGLLCGLSLLLVLSTAQSKLDWYVTPMIPLFALAAAVGTADVLAWAGRIAPRARVAMNLAMGAGLVAALAATLVTVQTLHVTSHGRVDGPQFGYARMFARLEASGLHAVIAVDGGFINAAGFKGYNPILKFYALREQGWGLRVEVRRLGEALPMGAELVTCDPEALEPIQDDYRLNIQLRDRGCVLARVEREVP